MLGFILLLFIFTSIWVGMISGADVKEVKDNWPKYRCRPNIMPFAGLYGHNTAENFNFCLSNMFGSEMSQALGPVFTILGTMVTTLVTLIQVANSIRLQFATMMGGINTLFQNFADRFKQLLSAVQMSAYRIKLIMGRLYGAFFAMLYMSIAGMTAVDNFTRTALFGFLDTFCFDPDTIVEIQGKGRIPVRSVEMGDVFAQTGGTVTSLFQFEADGQAMVELPGAIVVSTNHYVNYLGRWIQAKDHPLAEPKGVWKGGHEKPLICFNTSDHKIPIGAFVFLDYDETEEGDQETMKWIESSLNSVPSKQTKNYSYNSCVDANTRIRMADGSVKPISAIALGDKVSTGTVISVIQKESNRCCQLPTGEWVAPGLCYWDTHKWVRAGDTREIHTSANYHTMYSLVVLNTATYETQEGTYMRDYVEIHSPEAEQFYSQAVKMNDFKIPVGVTE